ncbi:venom factor-like [Ruditapes philippinarum]|uniref:venom factor-like n=1 Tax=Ruditapes philippinarum TaxID=129788 RepID=UPI00295B8D76|nr:venom factor-like [Ruditapes philippinarum]
MNLKKEDYLHPDSRWETMFILFISFWIFVSEVQGGYYFVIAPNVIRFEQDETVVVSVFGETDAAVKLWIEHEGKQFSMKKVVVKDQETPTYSTVKVQEADIFDSMFDKKPRKVKLCSEWKGTKQSREIILSYHLGYLIVQTDKPIYTPRQKVRIRTLALDESLKAVDGWLVGMDIISPSNITMGRKLIKHSPTGFFQNDFILPPYPEMGVWTARSFYNGRFETESRALFEVREYVPITFEVTVGVDVDFLLPDTRDITVTVEAKYVYGKPVEGNARLMLTLKGDDKICDYILDTARKQLENNGHKGSVTEFNINVAQILNSSLLSNKSFPSGKRLEVITIVYESATGNEEARSHEDTIFTMNPYIYEFTKSKQFFRPELEYYLKVQVLYVNGKAASNKDFLIRMNEDGTFKEERNVTTNDKGLAIGIFQTSSEIQKISFTVSSLDMLYESDIYEVTAYSGKNQIQIERVDTEKNMIRAFTNTQGNTSTGMLIVGVARGKVVYTKYKEESNVANEEITEDLQELVSPDTRLLVFFVDYTTHELAADSTKFEVEKTCRGKRLNLVTDRKVVKPGTRVTLIVTGTPFMHIGLNIIDRALLLQDDKNVLRKNKMFETLQSHDLGCGEGGGRSGADVFKKTGLTVLTNSLLDENDIIRTTAGCKGNTRKRRDAYGQLDENSDYWEDMAKLANAGIQSYTRSDYRESWMFDVFSLDKNGQMQIELNVPDTMTEWSIQAIGITENDGMCIADEIDLMAFRDFFIQLDLPFKATRFEHFNVKATIFNYGVPNDDNKTVSIYLQGVDNLCSNSDPGKPSPRVKIELPPNSEKIVTFPVIPLKSGLYPVKMTAIVSNGDIPEVDVVEKKLYVVNEGIEEQITIVVCLDPINQTDDCKNGKRVVREFQVSSYERQYVIDLTLPRNTISQTGAATAYIQGIVMTNVVNTTIRGVDSLFRKPIGFGEQTMIRLATNVYALAYLKETEQETVEIEAKGYQWIREGIRKQISKFRQHDGSYAIMRSRPPSTWLTAFVAKVFCQANTVVDYAVVKEKYIKHIINWLNYNMHADGSFTDNMPVLHREMMGQINERDPSFTAYILIALQECGGKYGIVSASFDRSVHYIERLPERKLKNNPYLLAITTYALALSDSTKTYTFVKYLKDIKKIDREGTFWGNPGGKPANANSVETTAYALLALLQYGDIKTSSSIVSWLTSQRDATGSFKTTQDTVVGLQALSQYKIATKSREINLNVTIVADNLVGKQRQITTENGIVQHIIEDLPVKTGNNTISVIVEGRESAVMSIDLRYNRPASTEEHYCPFTITDIDVQDAKDAPINNTLARSRNCDVCGQCEEDDKGNNTYADSDYFGDPQEIEPREKSYIGRKKGDSSHRTNLTVKIKCIRFSISSKNNDTYGMSIVKFGLETGVGVIKSDLDKLVADKANIKYYEMPSDGRGFIMFYLNEISSSKTSFIFRLKDSFDGEINSRQPSSIYVYDYYNPERHCTQFYGTGPNGAKSVSYKCESNKKECVCARSMCVQPVENEIQQLIRMKKKPVPKLFNSACNTDKAKYAVRVRIDEVMYDETALEKIARGTVMTTLRQGIESLHDGDVMSFFWNSTCQFPELEQGKTYIIIGKDGFKIRDGENEVYRSPLLGTTLVIEYIRPQYRKYRMKYRILYAGQKQFGGVMSGSGGCKN